MALKFVPSSKSPIPCELFSQILSQRFSLTDYWGILCTCKHWYNWTKKDPVIHIARLFANISIDRNSFCQISSHFPRLDFKSLDFPKESLRVEIVQQIKKFPDIITKFEILHSLDTPLFSCGNGYYRPLLDYIEWKGIYRSENSYFQMISKELNRLFKIRFFCDPREQPDFKYWQDCVKSINWRLFHKAMIHDTSNFGGRIGSVFVELLKTFPSIQDKEFILTVVSHCGYAFRFADKVFRKDPQYVLAAVEQNHSALAYAHIKIQNDKEFVLTAIKKQAHCMKYASKNLKNDKEVVLAAVYQNGDLLQFASEDLKNDKEVVLVAVQQNGRALEFASEGLKKDKDFILSVLRNGYYARPFIHFTSEDLRKDKEVLLAASFS